MPLFDAWSYLWSWAFYCIPRAFCAYLLPCSMADHYVRWRIDHFADFSGPPVTMHAAFNHELVVENMLHSETKWCPYLPENFLQLQRSVHIWTRNNKLCLVGHSEQLLLSSSYGFESVPSLLTENIVVPCINSWSQGIICHACVEGFSGYLTIFPFYLDIVINTTLVLRIVLVVVAAAAAASNRLNNSNKSKSESTTVDATTNFGTKDVLQYAPFMAELRSVSHYFPHLANIDPLSSTFTSIAMFSTLESSSVCLVSSSNMI